jgi:hypothetical protein
MDFGKWNWTGPRPVPEIEGTIPELGTPCAGVTDTLPTGADLNRCFLTHPDVAEALSALRKTWMAMRAEYFKGQIDFGFCGRADALLSHMLCTVPVRQQGFVSVSDAAFFLNVVLAAAPSLQPEDADFYKQMQPALKETFTRVSAAFSKIHVPCCEVCGAYSQEPFVMCGGCYDMFHASCLSPPVTDFVRLSPSFCPGCLSKDRPKAKSPAETIEPQLWVTFAPALDIGGTGDLDCPIPPGPPSATTGSKTARHAAEREELKRQPTPSSMWALEDLVAPYYHPHRLDPVLAAFSPAAHSAWPALQQLAASCDVLTEKARKLVDDGSFDCMPGLMPYSQFSCLPRHARLIWVEALILCEQIILRRSETGLAADKAVTSDIVSSYSSAVQANPALLLAEAVARSCARGCSAEFLDKMLHHWVPDPAFRKLVVVEMEKEARGTAPLMAVGPFLLEETTAVCIALRENKVIKGLVFEGSFRRDWVAYRAGTMCRRFRVRMASAERWEQVVDEILGLIFDKTAPPEKDRIKGLPGISNMKKLAHSEAFSKPTSTSLSWSLFWIISHLDPDARFFRPTIFESYLSPPWGVPMRIPSTLLKLVMPNTANIAPKPATSALSVASTVRASVAASSFSGAAAAAATTAGASPRPPQTVLRVALPKPKRSKPAKPAISDMFHIDPPGAVSFPSLGPELDEQLAPLRMHSWAPQTLRMGPGEVFGIPPDVQLGVSDQHPRPEAVSVELGARYCNSLTLVDPALRALHSPTAAIRGMLLSYPLQVSASPAINVICSGAYARAIGEDVDGSRFHTPVSVQLPGPSDLPDAISLCLSTPIDKGELVSSGRALLHLILPAWEAAAVCTARLHDEVQNIRSVCKTKPPDHPTSPLVSRYPRLRRGPVSTTKPVVTPMGALEGDAGSAGCLRATPLPLLREAISSATVTSLLCSMHPPAKPPRARHVEKGMARAESLPLRVGIVHLLALAAAGFGQQALDDAVERRAVNGAFLPAIDLYAGTAKYAELYSGLFRALSGPLPCNMVSAARSDAVAAAWMTQLGTSTGQTAPMHRCPPLCSFLRVLSPSMILTANGGPGESTPTDSILQLRRSKAAPGTPDDGSVNVD